MDKEQLQIVKWELSGIRTILRKLQETDEEQSDLFFVLAEMLDLAIAKLNE